MAGIFVTHWLIQLLQCVSYSLLTFSITTTCLFSYSLARCSFFRPNSKITYRLYARHLRWHSLPTAPIPVNPYVADSRTCLATPARRRACFSTVAYKLCAFFQVSAVTWPSNATRLFTRALLHAAQKSNCLRPQFAYLLATTQPKAWPDLATTKICSVANPARDLVSRVGFLVAQVAALRFRMLAHPVK